MIYEQTPEFEQTPSRCCFSIEQKVAGNCQAPKMTNKHLKSIITVNMTYEHKTCPGSA